MGQSSPLSHAALTARCHSASSAALPGGLWVDHLAGVWQMKPMTKSWLAAAASATFSVYAPADNAYPSAINLTEINSEESHDSRGDLCINRGGTLYQLQEHPWSSSLPAAAARAPLHLPPAAQHPFLTIVSLPMLPSDSCQTLFSGCSSQVKAAFQANAVAAQEAKIM